MPLSTVLLRRLGAPLAALACLAVSALAWGAPKAYVGNFKDDTVSVIDTASASVVATVAVGAGPHGMGISPDGRKVYVSGDGASTVTVIDTATDRAAAQIEVGRSPHGVAMQPDGRFLLVGVYGDDRVVWIDTASNAVAGSVAVPKPHTIAVHPDGRTAYVASQEPGRFALVVIDVAARAVLRALPLDKPPRDLEFGFDGSRLYVTQAGVNAVQVLDPATDRVVASVATGVSPHLASVWRGAPAGLALVQGPGELLMFDAATNAPGASVAVGRQPHWMAPFGRGGSVAVTNEGADSVSLVDLASRSVRTVAVGRAPRKVVVQPEGGAPSAGAAVQPAAGATVSIAGFAFRPATLDVGVGTRVTWTNDDGAPHGLRFDDGATGVDPLLPKQSFARTFDRPGSYGVVCSVHPYMTATVVVRP